MRVACALLFLAAPAAAQEAIYTNEEEVYFAAEKKLPAIPWMGVKLTESGGETSIERIDAFGKPAAGGGVQVASATPERLTVLLDDGRPTTLRRARTVSCWSAIPKDKKKADGSEDWYFVRDLKLHDQGGRVAAGGGDTGAKPLVLRMRNVVWSEGPNRPSLVLYVHTPDAPDKAVSYSWADPDAKRIGINLRWMQASCTIDPKQGETPQ